MMRVETLSAEVVRMDGIASISTTLATDQAKTAVAVYAVKQANAQQQAALSLLDAAMELAQQIQEPGVGTQVNTYA